MHIFLNRLYPPLKGVSPNIALLLLCVQHHLTSVQVARLRHLADGEVDWGHLAQLAIDQRVNSLVYWNLRTYAKDLVPAEHLKTFEEHFFRTSVYNVDSKRELIRLIRALQNEGIEAMPVRGPILAYLLYDKLWLREFKDNDILVPEEKFARAEQILLSLGYEQEGPVEDNAYNQKLYHARLNSEVELHWGLDSPFMPVDVAFADYWDRSISLQLDDVTVQTLSLEDLLLMLCFHGAKHRWHRLKWLCDISEFVRKYPDLDWNAILEEARTLRIKRIVLLNLWLAHLLFETALPPIVVEQIEHDGVHVPLGHYIRVWMFSQFENRFIDQVRGIVFFLTIREHIRDRLPSIRHAIQYPKSPLAKRALGLLRRGKRAAVYRFTTMGMALGVLFLG
jgi:hypothetical protein